MSGEEVHLATLYRLSKESNGLALWIPGRIVKKLGLRPGEKMLVLPQDKRIILIPAEEVEKHVIQNSR